MKTKYGKWYARWTDAEGHRREKACKTKRAAAKLQKKMQAEAAAKKHQPSRASRPSRSSGQKAGHGRRIPRSQKTSSQQPATSTHAS